MDVFVLKLKHVYGNFVYLVFKYKTTDVAWSNIWGTKNIMFFHETVFRIENQINRKVGNR